MGKARGSYVQGLPVLQSKFMASPGHLVISCLKMRGKEMNRPEDVAGVEHSPSRHKPQVPTPSTLNQDTIKTLKCLIRPWGVPGTVF